MKAKMSLVAVLGIAILAWVPAVAAENAPVVVSLEEGSADACLDYTPLEGSELQPALLLGVEGEAVAPKPKPCRACPDQPWCACTYNNQPRISCDPCCYQTYTGVICTS